ncbi:D-aspartate oxidase-like [Coccinella septempunctata]|uniref:D-aspartate oxidase-like n=1 Tax=Coccinella septempunctata TaxID=41139 RepID=UPI001D06F92D|nr:D-aspartate oxidase-like [Coccinella septempunctata]
MSDLKIAVLGAGIVGSTTVIELKKEFRNASVHIISEKFQNETTSYVAAGIFSPEGGNLAGNEERTRKWLVDSYNYWNNIRRTQNFEMTGVRELSGYIFSRDHPHIVKNEWLEKLLPLYRAAEEDEMAMYPGGWKYGSYFTTLQTVPGNYLKWTANIIEDLGIKVEKRKVSSFAEVCDDFDILVNCTGMGAKFLCKDKAVFPLRGQLSIVRAPWIKEFVFGEWDTYVIPSFENVILGGCRQYESYDTAVNRYDALSMEERCKNMIPSLNKGQLVEYRVGLRPYRVPTRVEKEYRLVGSKLVKIVHNYGHGGQGITFSPGTSLNAVQLVRDMLTEKQSKL